MSYCQNAFEHFDNMLYYYTFQPETVAGGCYKTLFPFFQFQKLERLWDSVPVHSFKRIIFVQTLSAGFRRISSRLPQHVACMQMITESIKAKQEVQ